MQRAEKKLPGSPLWVWAQTYWEPSLLVRETERQGAVPGWWEEGGGQGETR